MITTVNYDEDKGTVCVKVCGVDTFVCIDKIRYVDTYKNYIICHLNDGTQVRERKALYQFAKENSCGVLLQINKGCIVNLKYVHAIKNRRVLLCSGENFGMMRGREREIKQRYFAYKMKTGENGM